MAISKQYQQDRWEERTIHERVEIDTKDSKALANLVVARVEEVRHDRRVD